MYALRPIVENIEIGRIEPPAFQFRSELVVDDLMESIRQRGLLYPIIVRVRGDRFELVAGHRRLTAFKKLGLRRIPAHILELDDRDAYEISLIENVQRRTMDPMDEARAFDKYVEEYGFGGMTELAGKIGKSVTYVSRRIALLQLPKDVQEGVLRRRKSASLALELLALDDSQAITELARQADSMKLSVQGTRRLVRSHRRRNTIRPSSEEERVRLTVRAIDRGITAMKLAMTRIDDAIESVKKDWFVRELLFQYRVGLHDNIDSLVHLKKKFYQRAQNGQPELPASDLV